MWITVSLFSALGVVACDGGGGVVGEAQKLAEEGCACEDVGCARGKSIDINKIAVKRSDEVDALDADDKKKFEAAADKAKACWEEMQPAE